MTDITKNMNDLKVGFVSSVLMTVLTVIGFGFAMMAIPPSGPYCPGDCMDYPYSGLLDYYPRDYLWMYLISFQLCVFLVFIIAHHFNAVAEKKIYSFISVAFAMMATTVLLSNYFIQYSVVPISILKGETEGISLLTQYNGHGVFIALEELGFILISLAFIFLSPIYSGRNRLEKSLKWIFAIPFVLVIMSFVYYIIQYGIDRDYRFEVAAITINWFATIVVGTLCSIYYLKKIGERIASKDT